MIDPSLKEFLDKQVDEFNRPAFIVQDPVSIPHLFLKNPDREIAGFFAATFAWGNRSTIISKSKELLALMDNEPHQFCLHHSEKELKNLEHFRHRTFNSTDLLYFISFFHFHYNNNDSLEPAFTKHGETIREMLAGFHHYFFSLPHVPGRTLKHVATPERNSSCKRLNMFLRWMVRKDENGVDFGIWENISPSILICPIDLHVSRVSKKLGLIKRKQTDWLAAEELTAQLRLLDKDDPVKYDLALFGLGVTNSKLS